MTTLSLPRDRAPRLVARYEYPEWGIRKLRLEPKAFRMRCVHEGYIKKRIRECPEHAPTMGEALFNWHEVHRQLRFGRDVYWCEGEKDALAVGRRATSHWQGAGNATEEQAELFRPFKRATVYVIADVDDPGAFCALRRESLLLSLGVGLRVVILAPPYGYGDAADALQDGRSLSDFRRPNRRRLKRAAARHEAERRSGKRYG